jgi:hypothetical protein
MLAKRLLALVAMLALLTGCYCPALSGRYCELGPYPPCGPCLPGNARCLAAPAASDARGPADDCLLGGCGGRFGGRFGGRSGGPGRAGLARRQGAVPSQQRADYVSPEAKFHPVPTRPAFEPQLAARPAVLLDPAPAGGSKYQISGSGF